MGANKPIQADRSLEKEIFAVFVVIKLRMFMSLTGWIISLFPGGKKELCSQEELLNLAVWESIKTNECHVCECA